MKNNKLDKGTYSNTAGDLKADIDTRLPKGAYTGDAYGLYQFTGRTYTRMMYILGQHDGDFPLSFAKKIQFGFYQAIIDTIYVLRIIMDHK